MVTVTDKEIKAEVPEELEYEEDFILEEPPIPVVEEISDKPQSVRAKDMSMRDVYEDLIEEDFNLLSVRRSGDSMKRLERQETTYARVEHRLNKSDLRRVDGEIFVELDPGNIITIQALSNQEVNRSHIPEHTF